MSALLEDLTSNLPDLIREQCQDLLVQIAEKAARIAERTAKLKTAVAVEVFGCAMTQFKTGATLRLGWVLCPSSILRETRNAWGAFHSKRNE